MALIDRVRAVLVAWPDAPLGLVCLAVADDRRAMVATLMRMVTIAARRATVQAPTQSSITTAGTCPLPQLTLTGSLRASPHVGGR